MNRPILIKDDLWWIGVNDRTSEFFEALWPLDKGITYNSYLLAGDKTAVIDGVKSDFYPQYIQNIKDILGERQVDYMIVNHVEPDHSSSLEIMLQAFPAMTVVGNSKTLQYLEQFYGPLKNRLEVQDNGTLDLGGRTLFFVQTPMVHWPETMVTFDSRSKGLFTCDAFGSFGALDGGLFDDELDIKAYRSETYRYFANIVGKYSLFVEKALDKIALSGLDPQMICPSHGPVYRKDPAYIMDFYRSMATQKTEEAALVVYGSMYGNTAKLAGEVARGLKEGGVSDVTVMNSSSTDLSYMVQEVWRCRGLILVGCTYNGGVFPKIQGLIDSLLGKKITSRHIGLCGSYTWSKGAAMRPMREFASQCVWNKVEPEVEAKSRPSKEDLDQALELGKNMAKAILS